MLKVQSSEQNKSSLKFNILNIERFDSSKRTIFPSPAGTTCEQNGFFAESGRILQNTNVLQQNLQTRLSQKIQDRARAERRPVYCEQFKREGRSRSSVSELRIRVRVEPKILHYLTAVVIHIRSNNSSSPAKLILQERGSSACQTQRRCAW